MNLTSLAPIANSPILYPPDTESSSSNTIQKFAADNGFEYFSRKPELVEYDWHDYKSLPAWLGMVGITAAKDAYNVVSGDFMGYPFTMFLMWDKLTDGMIYRQPNEQQRLQYIQQQTTGIIKITLPKLFPQIVLDSNKNDRMQSSIRTEYLQSQRITLEGDFGDYFDLYVPSGLQVDALSLLAPNFMQMLKGYSGLFDVEFNNNEMIFMTRKPLYDLENMKLFQLLIAEQLTYMSRLLQSWNYVPTQLPIDRLEKPYIGGSEIKIGHLRLGAKFQLTAIAVLFLLFALAIILLK